MNWTNVKLILGREIRDQLRDRRTMFMIVVMPVLLYPLMMSVAKISQLAEERPARVLVLGARYLPEDPPLVENNRFAPGLFSAGEKRRLLELVFEGDEPARPGQPAPDLRLRAKAAVLEGQCEVALYIPPDFADRLARFQEAVRQQVAESLTRSGSAPVPWALATPVPRPEVFYSTAERRSQTAFALLSAVLSKWTESIGRRSLEAAGVPQGAATPVEAEAIDVAEETGHRGAALWASTLPVLLVIWALTGAFYPAVDLCAGEKERGTLETLLSSPAGRGEIVLGKLATVMLFSSLTTVLNLGGMVLLGTMVFARGFGTPPAPALVWLPVALVPISALFSALCLALAALARSTKEGQYYLTPLLLLTLPLAVVPAVTGMELNLGNSLLPVTGIVLVLREALAGNGWQAAQFLPPVVAVTVAACVMAVRWAVDQFNKESVLFREGERLELRLWLRQVVRERGPRPTPAAALLCGVLILAVQFFLGMAARVPESFTEFAATTLVTQLAAVVAPAAILAVMLTRDPRGTLLLGGAPWRSIGAAVLLAAALQPLARQLEQAVLWLYPLPESVGEQVARYLAVLQHAPLWQRVLVLALVPALCEELAFRGFILSGFRQSGAKWRAIVWTAVLFGLSHPILQQSLVSATLGMVIGLLAWNTGSLWPGVAFHFTHNALMVAGQGLADWHARWPALDYLYQPSEGGRLEYTWLALGLGTALAAGLVWWFERRGAGTRQNALPAVGQDASALAAEP